ncbi:MAG: tRNA preQ1(34) S-adenosylmethionine ribosyltransferase-isomerase QueA [Nitrospirae bacterium]|nr:tRNA preQ1(34) S-adenosylmethionine ribosyltransferase-isomerase QueA [Nitrospirota bacterium]
MKLTEFDFDLPPELIAQRPASARGESRLLLLHRRSGRVEHRMFHEIVNILRPGDVLVINDTRVRPARLYGRRPTGAKIEVLLLGKRDDTLWDAMLKGTSKGEIVFEDGLSAQISGREEMIFHLQFNADPEAWAERHGAVPLPPYIRRPADEEDKIRYQTVYASTPGAIAAPTAGLHFTPEIIDALKARGVEICPITLHVGMGTFKPVTAETITDHRMDEEEFIVGEDTARAVTLASAEERRIIAVGTTATRTLETAFRSGRLRAGPGATSLFITPGYKFRAVGGLLTNFHLPKATPLMLVSAFAGIENVRRAYRRAVKERYGFFSYGDAMLVL